MDNAKEIFQTGGTAPPEEAQAFLPRLTLLIPTALTHYNLPPTPHVTRRSYL